MRRARAQLPAINYNRFILKFFKRTKVRTKKSEMEADVKTGLINKKVIYIIHYRIN